MKNFQLQFLKSSLGVGHEENTLAQVHDWVEKQKKAVTVCLDRVKLSEMRHWKIDKASGSLCHDTGKFFSVDGIRVATNWGSIKTWDQPIINQSEVGYLGLIAKRISGTLHFLLQAKIEPGNLNAIQLSPTIQATRSNYTRVHGGSKPKYLDLFQDVPPKYVLLDQLQSEQGARFLMKRNRNMIILTEETIPVYDNFIWLTLRQIKRLMQVDNYVNMDTRTVISGIGYGDIGDSGDELIEELSPSDAIGRHRNEIRRSVFSTSQGVNSLTDIFHFLTDIKSKCDLDIIRKPLSELDGWLVNETEIARPDGKFFRIIGVDVAIGNREVQNWQQPMVQPAQSGLCGFIGKVIGGIMHFAVQAKVECGNRDIVELAPTVQCLTGDYRLSGSDLVPFLDKLLDSSEDMRIHDSMQSEEGGRFYYEENRNLIVIVGEELPDTLPANFIWMTIWQLMYFNQFNNYLNVQARSLLSVIELI